MCIRNLFKLLCNKYKKIILYCFFGCLTFVVDTGIFYILSRNFVLTDNSILLHVCSVFSTTLAIAFAYITNRKYVFESSVTNAKGVLEEIASFYFARIITMVLAEGFLEITIIHLGFCDWLMKLIANSLVVILNYLFSEFWIFSKK